MGYVRFGKKSANFAAQHRRSVKNYRLRMRAEGRCVVCGKQLEARTGRKAEQYGVYPSLCSVHAARKRVAMQRREGGIGVQLNADDPTDIDTFMEEQLLRVGNYLESVEQRRRSRHSIHEPTVAVRHGYDVEVRGSRQHAGRPVTYANQN